MSAEESGALPEALVKFVQVLAEDGDLRVWWDSLAELTDAARGREFHRLATRMQAAGEHAELVQATGLLVHPPVYHAAVAALQEG